MTDVPLSPKSDAAADATTASFGFENVPTGDKQARVDAVFHEVAERYDLMNDLMSGGLHRLWKRELVAMIDAPKSAQPFVLLDVAGGTGDIALRFLETCGAGGRVVLLDINAQMLRVGRARAQKAGRGGRMDFIHGNAEGLPLQRSSVDAYTIAFGIRNVPRIEAALAEAYRVLRPGSRFLCLEFGRVEVPVLDRLYDLWSFEAIPRIGERVAGAAQPYRYLVESIRRFPDQETFKQMIERAGFERVSYRNLTGGIAAIHAAWKL